MTYVDCPHCGKEVKRRELIYLAVLDEEICGDCRDEYLYGDGEK